MSDYRQAERSLLAAAMLDPAVLDLVNAEDFATPLPHEAWRAMGAIVASGGRPDLPTLAAALPDSAIELATISSETCSAANAKFYAEIITAAARARQAERIAAELHEGLERGEGDAIARASVALARLDAPRRPSLGFRFVRADTIEPHAPDWLARGYFVRDSLIVLFGAFGSLKSFVALDLAFCVASGTPWHGARVSPGAVVVIVGEGFGGLALRRRAWELARGLSLAGAPLFFSVSAARLGDPAFGPELERAVKAAADEAGGLALIIVDTWSRNLAGDENSSLDTAAAIRTLDAIRAPYHASIVVVHHEGWQGGRARGSTVLMAAADTSYRLERGLDGVARFTSEKIKDGRAPEPLAFLLRDIDLGLVDDEGKPVGSAVIERTEYTSSEEPKESRPADAAVLAEIEKASGTTADLAARTVRTEGAIRASCSRLQMAGKIVKIANSWMIPTPSAQPSAPAHRVYIPGCAVRAQDAPVRAPCNGALAFEGGADS